MSFCIVLLLTTPGFLRSTVSTVPSLEKLPEIMTAFARMRTLVDLFLANEWTLYISEYHTTTPKYDVPPQMVHTLLYKVRQAQKKKKKHIRLTKKKPDEKKLVLKKLREFIEEEAQAKGDQAASKPPV